LKKYLNKGFHFFINRICEIILLITVLLAFKQQEENGKWEHVIRTDGVGYYSVLPAVFIYNDASFSYLKDIQNKYNSEEYNGGFLIDTPEGKMDKYYIGLSCLWLPFFLIAHFLADFLGYSADGYSEIYHILILISASFYLWLGCRNVKKLLLNYAIPTGVAAVIIVIIVFGTNLSHYATYDSWSSHVYSFAMISIFLYQVDFFFRDPKAKKLYLISFILALIILLRPTNGIIVLMVPFFAGSLTKFMETVKVFRNSILKAALLFSVVLSLQFIFYYFEVGKFFVWSYDKETFDFTNPQIFNVLFSYRKGLFVYTPFFFIPLLGFIHLYKTNKFQLVVMSLFCCLALYIISSWWSWYYGCSLGERPFNDYIGLLALLMAFLYMELRPYLFKLVVFPIGILVVIYSQVLSYQYQNYIIHFIDMNKEKYWFSFMHTAPCYEGIVWENNFFLPDYPIHLAGIKASSTNKYVYAAAGDALTAVSDISRSSETFNLVSLPGNKIGFRARNGKFISVNSANGNALSYNSEKITEMETFETIFLTKDKAYLKTFNNKFVSLKGDTLIAIATNQSEAELFEIIQK